MKKSKEARHGAYLPIKIRRRHTHVDGVMLGHAAYQNPTLLGQVEARLHGASPLDLDTAVDAYREDVARQLAQKRRLHPLIKPILRLYNGWPGVRLSRRHLGEHAVQDSAPPCAVLDQALDFVHMRRVT